MRYIEEKISNLSIYLDKSLNHYDIEKHGNRKYYLRDQIIKWFLSDMVEPLLIKDIFIWSDKE
jgi:hypothetical protein